MRKTASLLVATLCIAFFVAFCTTAAFWTATTGLTDPTPHVAVNTESRQYLATSTTSQTHRYLGATQNLEATSGPRVLEFQSAARRNSTQTSGPLRANNTTRITVPVSSISNTSSISAQGSEGVVLPAWLLTFTAILVVLVVLAFLFFRLLSEGGNAPPVDSRPPVLVVEPFSQPQVERPRQIPIDGPETEAGQQKRSRASAETKRVTRIPIDTQKELREPENSSR